MSLLWWSNQNKINIFGKSKMDISFLFSFSIPFFFFFGGGLAKRGGKLVRRKADLSFKMSPDFNESKVQSTSSRAFFASLIDNPGKSSSLCDRVQLLCDVASSLPAAAAAVVSDPLPHHSFKWLLSTPMALTLHWLHIYPKSLHLQYLAPVPISPSLNFFQQRFSWSY